MIKTIGTAACTAVAVESDPYIPLTISWSSENKRQPLYWRITGKAGGELEIKVDAQSGAIRELVIIEAPPKAIGADTPDSREAEAGIPVFNRSPWGISTNPDYSEFKAGVVTSTEDLSFSMENGTIKLAFSTKRAVRALVCDNVQIYLAGDGSLSAVVVQSPSAT
ncbi:hypothetical protein OG399_33720 [Streptomyces achromogenes]